MKKRYLILVGLLAAAVLAAGCGKKKEEPVQKAEVTVTPTPKANGGLVDMQKTEDENAKIKNIIGTKTETSGSLVLINNMGDEISSIYIRPNVPEEEAYDEDGEDSWGNELVQGKFTLKNGDKTLYYYEKNQKDGDGNTITSFDIRISFTDEEKNECFFRDLPLSSIKQIALCMDGSGEDGIPYAKYLTTTGTKLVSTLKDVKERLGIDGEDSEEDEETEEETTPTPEPTDNPEVTDTPEEPTDTPEPTVAPDPEEPEDPEPDPGAEQASQYIGQSLDSLIGAMGSPASSDYEEDPGTGKTGYHHYDTFTVSTTVDENGNEIVAAIW